MYRLFKRDESTVKRTIAKWKMGHTSPVQYNLCNVFSSECSVWKDSLWWSGLECKVRMSPLPKMCIIITSADFTAKFLIFYMVSKVSASSVIWLWEKSVILILSLLGCTEEPVNVIGACLLCLEACFRLLSSWIQLCRKWYLIKTFHTVYSQKDWNSAI